MPNSKQQIWTQGLSSNLPYWAASQLPRCVSDTAFHTVASSHSGARYGLQQIPRPRQGVAESTLTVSVVLRGVKA